jgi:hypothetical protein
MREKFPEIHFQSMVKLALVHRVELGQPKEYLVRPKILQLSREPIAR